MKAIRRRIDQLMVERGFAESRHKAQALLMAGQVLVGSEKVEKPGKLVDADAPLRILGATPFVSRAGGKLQAALNHFAISARGRICADLGAATGGFTDCLLQNGALAVHAYDVGAGQLAWKLSSDPRVVLHRRCNVRFLTAQDLPEGITLIAVDLSFISLTKVLVPVRDAVRARISPSDLKAAGCQADLILLVKPQFEVGRRDVGKGGIVRDPTKQRAALADVERFAGESGFAVGGSLPSPITGTGGNQEFLLHLQLAPDL